MDFEMVEKIVDLSLNKFSLAEDGILENSTFAKGDSWHGNDKE